MILLLITLILSMIFYGIRIAAWTMISIRCIINPNHKSVVALTEIGQKKMDVYTRRN